MGVDLNNCFQTGECVYRDWKCNVHLLVCLKSDVPDVCMGLS